MTFIYPRIYTRTEILNKEISDSCVARNLISLEEQKNLFDKLYIVIFEDDEIFLCTKKNVLESN